MLYIRVSTDEQSASIEAQRETACGSHRRAGCEIVSEFVGRKRQRPIDIDKRPALKRALKALADETADRLIVAKLDRLARNVRVALEIDEDYATRHGWGIVFGDMDVDTSTAVGKMQLSMFASSRTFRARPDQRAHPGSLGGQTRSRCAVGSAVDFARRDRRPYRRRT